MVAYIAIVAQGLTCIECDTFNDKDGCNSDKAVTKECLTDEDVCVAVKTVYQMPNNGPMDRFKDNDGNKITWNVVSTRLAALDSQS